MAAVSYTHLDVYKRQEEAMTKWTAREMALQVIYQVNEEQAYANLALDKMMVKEPEICLLYTSGTKH